MFKYFIGSCLFAVIALILAGGVGYGASGTISGMLSSVFICLVLSALEISLSFDNAIVNASKLKMMSPLWQKRFLTWGMVIAVFGMRLLFPLLIVAVIARLSPVNVVALALSHPKDYGRILAEAHTELMGFGGGFLSMVALNYFSGEKDIYWLTFLERAFARLGRMGSFEVLPVLVLIVLAAVFLVPGVEETAFLLSALTGVIAFIVIDALSGLAGGATMAGNGQIVAKAGLGSFIALEVMDASFSFDGVIGAFALSNNLLIITLGLGIGAMFVRSLTIFLVKTGHLSSFRYLEHGAFWAILALSVLMFLSVRIEIPDIITGGVGLGLIGLSVWSSLRWRREHRQDSQ